MKGMNGSHLKKYLLGACLIGGSFFPVQAQTIFSYGKNNVDKGEFVSMYESNNSKSTDFYKEADLLEYLELYSIFKMKVAEAKALKLDTAAALRHDVEQYKITLAKSFLVDESMSETLLKEAYERSKHELSIAHIQVSVRGTDTAAAFQKINDIYRQLQEGSLSFEEAAAKYSEDGASKNNGGAVGYISALDVVYPIETAAYNTPVGQYSQPLRSNMGYHIVKVLDKRPSKGQVQVSQILITANRKDAAATDVARSKANNIYEQLQAGADFEALVKTHSEDRFSVNNNGLLQPISSGKVDPAFEEAAFGLKKVGDISPPIQTDFGYHILRLEKKMAIADLETQRPELSTKIKNDGRLALAEEAMKVQWLKQIKFEEQESSLEELITEIQKDTARRSELKNLDLKALDNTMFTIAGKNFGQQDFIAFIEDATGGILYGRKDRNIRELYRLYKAKTIDDYQVEYLYQNNVDFRTQVNNYEESTLVFALMEQKVWNPAMNDKQGQLAFYEANKDKYLFDAGFAGNIFESGSKTSLELLRSKLLEGIEQYEAMDQVNKTEGEKVAMQSGKYEYEQMPAKLPKFETGKITEVFQAENGNFFFVVPTLTFEKNTQKTFEEASWVLISDYQAALEKDWLQQLRKKYPIDIKTKEVKKLVKKK